MLPPDYLCSRIVAEISFEHSCQNIVQHICEEHYHVPVPVITPAPIFPTPVPPVTRTPRSHLSPRPSQPPEAVTGRPVVSASQRPSKRPSIRFRRAEPQPSLVGLNNAAKSAPAAHHHVSHQELPSPPGCRSILTQKCQKVPVKITRKLPDETCEEIPDIVCHLELETYEEPVCHNVENQSKVEIFLSPFLPRSP